jgi:hypothetical protein
MKGLQVPKNNISLFIFTLKLEHDFANRKIFQRGHKRNLKFSAVLGAISAKSSILIRPAGIEPIVTSKNTIGFLGFVGL